MTPELNAKNEEQLPIQHIALFIDDSVKFSQKWERCFAVPGIAPLRPDIDSVSEEEIPDRISAFMKAQEKNVLEQTALVVIDQFADDPYLFDAGQEFVTRLREVNTSAWILETSGVTSSRVYSGSNAFFSNLKLGDAHSLIQLSPPIAVARIAALGVYCNNAFVEAGIADPNYTDESNRLLLGPARRQSFQRLWQSSEFQLALGQMGFDVNSEVFSLDSVFKKLDETHQRLFLHCAWNIVGHMQINSGPELYGTLYTRLKRIIKP